MNENYMLRGHVEDIRDTLYGEFVDLALYLQDLLYEIDAHEGFSENEAEDIKKSRDLTMRALRKLESEITSL